MPVPNMPNLRRTYQTPSSLNGASLGSAVAASSPAAPFTNFRNFSHGGSPAPSPSGYSSSSSHSAMVAPSPSVTSGSLSNASSTTSVALPGLTAVPGKYNGYADLPNQVYRRSVRKGFSLNIIVVGETGTGKSTFVNSLFSADIYDGKESQGISERIGSTIQVEKTRVTLIEKGVQVRLTIVDVPGFGHYVNNTNAWDSVVAYIEKRYHEYLEREMSVKRNLQEQVDDRVHCCLYFIAPNGHGLRPLDIQAMKALGTKVNVIPVIGRADALTVEECKEFKEKVRQELKDNDIKLYDFPVNSDSDNEDDDDFKRNGKNGKENSVRAMLPFAVVGSNTFIDTKDGRKVRGRRYPWGTVEIDNPDHSDFTVLRKLLLRIYLSDLMDVTNDVHYENYRCEYFNRVSPMGNGSRTNSVDGVLPGTPMHGNMMKLDAQRSPISQLETEKQEMEAKIQKMKTEMQAIFDQKVREKEQKLTDTEKDLEKKYQNWDKDWEASRKKLEQDRAEYDMQKRQFGDAYPQLYAIMQDQLLLASGTDSGSSGGSPGGTGNGTILKKPAKIKKSFLEKVM